MTRLHEHIAQFNPYTNAPRAALISRQEQNATLMTAKQDLYMQLQSEQDSVADCDEKLMTLVQQKAGYETQIQVDRAS